MRRLLVVAALTCLAAPAAGASAARYSFGREGGNIIPFTVTIAATGAVHASGPVKVGRAHLTTAQLASLGKVAKQARFSALPATTLCSGTLPDIASTFVAAGSHTVRVHGSCSTRFSRVWNALAAAVRLSYG
jgi:hypothetical protein